jgi:glycosyltransferase A (GT-A) superfamily protein (DUF2064 family)
MVDILRSLNLENVWQLLPMLDSSSCRDTSYEGVADYPVSDLNSSDLGDKLAHALINARELFTKRTKQDAAISFTSTTGESIRNATGGDGGAVVFLGMDSPEINVEEIYSALLSSSTDMTTHICPAYDGGYGMICIPESAPPTVFKGVLWSHRLTCISQLQALGHYGIRNICVGSLMHDIDEMKDILALAHRLCQTWNNNNNNNNKASSFIDKNRRSFKLDETLKFRCGRSVSSDAYKGSYCSWTTTTDSQNLCKHTWAELCRMKVVIPCTSPK